MALSMTELRALLNPEEPNYGSMKSRLTPEDIADLLVLMRGTDVMMASKAAYALTLIEDAATIGALDAAVSSPREVVRQAAAFGLRNLGMLDVSPLTERLLDDTNTGVRKSAIKTVGILGLRNLNAKIERIATNDPEPGLRALARETLRG